MITNPYKVLGVPDGASEEECTKAYKRLAKKYHPDLNPNDKEAERKMAEINAAYDQIKNGNAASSSNGYSYSRSSQSNSAPNYLSSAAQFIRSGQYRQAINLLNNIEDRNAQWYYLSALANMSLGNRGLAEEQIRTAYSMEPQNTTYQQAYNNIINGINPLNYNPFSSFFDSDDTDFRSSQQQSTRQSGGYTFNLGCIGRILRIILIMIAIRLIIRFVFFIGGSLLGGFRYNYNNNNNNDGKASESQHYEEENNYGDFFGDSSSPTIEG